MKNLAKLILYTDYPINRKFHLNSHLKKSSRKVESIFWRISFLRHQWRHSDIISNEIVNNYLKKLESLTARVEFGFEVHWLHLRPVFSDQVSSGGKSCFVGNSWDFVESSKASYFEISFGLYLSISMKIFRVKSLSVK